MDYYFIIMIKYRKPLKKMQSNPIKLGRYASLFIAVVLLVGVAVFLGEIVTDAQAAASAITANPLTVGSINGGSATTATITVPANHLALMWVAQNSGSAGVPSLTDSSRTWAMEKTQLLGIKRLTLFRSLEPVDTVSAITITSQPTVFVWSVVEYGNVDTSGSQGSGAIAQSVTKSNSTAGTAASITLVPSSETSSATVGAFLMSWIGRPLFAGTGYTFSGSSSCNLICAQPEFRNDFAQIVDMTWSIKSPWVGIAAELRANQSVSSPTPEPEPNSTIKFTKKTNLDSIVPIPNGTYLDLCYGGSYLKYDAFIDPAPCGQNNKGIVYESEVQILDDPLGTGRGRVLKHYAYTYTPNNGEHHGFIFARGPQEPYLCASGDCWYGALYYFPMSFPGATGVSRMLLHGSQGTASAGPYVYLSPPSPGSSAPTGSYNRIFFGKQGAHQGIPIVTGKWISVRVHTPTGANKTATLWVTDLDGNPVVAGAATSLTTIYSNIPGNVTKVKFGSDSEPDKIAIPTFHWYEDNMYIAVQAENPGIWKE